jgi:copper chaperone CopZ
MKRLYIGLAGVLCLLASVPLQAQVKDSVNSKLKNLEGEVSKITVQTDKGTVTFEGDEAEYLLKRMKKKEFSFAMPEDLFADHDFKDLNIRMRDFKMPHIKMFRHIDDDELSTDNFNKKITVEKKDGETKVTVKSLKDGDELIETYEGKDAEKYLEEMNEEEPVSFDFKSKDKDYKEKETRIIIIK